MEEVFVPELAASYRWLSLCIIAGLTGAVLAVAAVRRPSFPVRVAAQVVGGLVALCGTFGALMVGWDMVRTPTIVVAADYALLGNDTLRPTDIQRVFIKPLAAGAMSSAQASVDLGILEARDGSVSLFADKNYDVKALVGALRRLQEGE